jgi:hypothetical protein
MRKNDKDRTMQTVQNIKTIPLKEVINLRVHSKAIVYVLGSFFEVEKGKGYIIFKTGEYRIVSMVFTRLVNTMSKIGYVLSVIYLDSKEVWFVKR